MSFPAYLLVNPMLSCGYTGLLQHSGQASHFSQDLGISLVCLPCCSASVVSAEAGHVSAAWHIWAKHAHIDGAVSTAAVSVTLTCNRGLRLGVLPAGLRNKRRKKAGRLNTHIMDDFVEMDDSQDGADTPVGMRPGAGRRPTAMLRPLSGTSDRQCACPFHALVWLHGCMSVHDSDDLVPMPDLTAREISAVLIVRSGRSSRRALSCTDSALLTGLVMSSRPMN